MEEFRMQCRIKPEPNLRQVRVFKAIICDPEAAAVRTRDDRGGPRKNKTRAEYRFQRQK